MKVLYTLPLVVLLLLATTGFAQTTIVDPTAEGGFEVTTGWSIVNDGENEWYSTANYLCSGTRGAYIGRSNANNNYRKNQTRVSHLYRDVTFPAGETDITLDFTYRCLGEVSYDGMKVYLIPTSTTPAAGTELGSGQIGSTWYNNQASCTNTSITIDGTNAGTTMRLVFSWVNDNSGGSNPAVTLDNVSLVSQTVAPTCSDGIQNGTETGVDCGGSCAACPTTHTMGAGDLTICSATVYDPGGPTTNYSANDYYTETYCSDGSDCLSITFTSFNTESGYDFLRIYDGPTIGSTLIGVYSGTSLPNGGTIGSSTGCLTLLWDADGSYQYAGWEATLSCSACPTCSDGIQNGSEGGIDCGGTCPTACPCEDVTVASLPYSSTGNNTSGFGDDYSSADACGSSYLNGDDIVYKYTPGSDDCINVNLTNTGTYVGVFIMDGCPDASGTSCVATATSAGGNPSLSGVTLTGGTDYYIVISTWAAPQSTAFDISITSSGLNPAFTPVTCAAALGTGVVAVGSLPYASGAGTTCGAVDDITSSDIVTCGSTLYSGEEDQVFVFTPAATGSVTFAITSANSYTALSLYEDCPLDANCTPVTGTCITSSKSYTASKSFTECVTAGVTYYLVLDSWNGGGCISYSDLTISAPSGSGAPANDSPCTAEVLTPGASCSYVTYNNVCASNSGIADPGCASYVSRDLWFKATVPASGNLVFDTDDADITDGGMAIYSGTCGALTLIECDDFDSDNGNMPRICRSAVGVGDCSGFACGTGLTPGSDVFIRVWEDGADNNGTFQLCVWEPVAPAAPVNDDPCNATLLSVGVSCLYSTYTNDCATASSGVPGPGCTTYLGGDVWFKAEIPASGSIALNSNTGNITDGGMAIYTGTCGALALVECDDSDSENGGMPLIQNYSLTPGDTVWVRFWEDGNDVSGTFDMCLYDPCPNGSPSNDLPCNATVLTLGSFASGNNSCSDATSEPGAASCWTTGNVNTVWYEVTAPASGQLEIKTLTGGLTDTQIALYSGTCGSPVEIDCNNDYTSCGTTVYGSEISVSGLTSGSVYFIAVDGAYDYTGTFSIIAIDGTASYPVVPGQDCSISESIAACNDNLTVGNPGYAGTGTTCNFDGTNNCTGGEKNSVWYLITIASNGSLDFNIVPNDYTSGACGSETDYDYLLWRISGSGTTTDCAGILADPGTGLVACNYSSYGVTGLTGTGDAPATYGTCYDAAYEPTVAVTAGDQFLLSVQNYSGSSQGFTLDLAPTTAGVIDYSPPATLTWSGGSTTEWGSSTNWGSCTEPDCGINALVIGGPANQPIVSDSVTVEDLTINPGAVLTLQAGSILRICGNLTNNGSIVCDPTATILFNNGSTTQEITGTFTGNNALGTIVIEKTGGELAIGQDIEIQGDLTTVNSTSVFNTGGHYVMLGGDLNNADANNTYAGVGSTGTLEFNGTGPQEYTGGGTLVLNDMVMNNTGTGLTLNDQINLSGMLTLTEGKVFTSTTSLLNLTSTASASSGTATSFVDGPLQKAGNTAFVFPVGNSATWARIGMSAPSGSGASSFRAEYTDGSYSNTSSINTGSLNNVSVVEWWNFERINGTRSTEITLYWEDGTRSGITDLADLAVAHWTSGQWENETNSGGTSGGTGAGTVTSQTLSSFSPITFGSDLDSDNPLPVELLSFSGKKVPYGNELHWETSTEVNSNYFAVERATDAETFTQIGRIEAAGTTNEKQVYDLLDSKPAIGNNYYRLKQVDTDGTTVYSRIVELQHEAPDVTTRIYPNPAQNELAVEFKTPQEAPWTVSIVDLSGRKVANQVVNGNEGTNNVRLDLTQLAKGVYTIQLEDATQAAVYTERFTKQ